MTHNHVAHAKHLAARLQHRAHGEVNQALAKLRAQARTRGGAFISEAKIRGGEFLNEARERGGDWIGENPARAVGLAFAAGFIVRGWLSRGRD